MGFKSSPVLAFLLLFCSINPFLLVTSDQNQTITTRPNRESLEIIIGGGDGGAASPNCAPPPPPPCSPPPQTRLAIAKRTILEFKKQIMVDRYHITDTWDPARNVCDYKGMACAFLHTYSQPALYYIKFNGYGFAGAGNFLDANPLITGLPDISIFHANSNNFTGIIPAVDKFPYLYELDLSNNQYQGEFPRSVLGPNQLTFLDLRFNTFAGRVPAQIFTLDLLALFINNNNFQQELPDNLGATPVAFLTLANNQFTGHIPKSIGMASKTLLEVLFLNNLLTGCLPYEIGLLKMARVFDVEGNHLTGPIPHSFGCLGNMQYLIMARNQFYGEVPETVCKLPKLRNLTLNDNYFTHVGPACWELIERKVLDIRGNCVLDLPHQKSAEQCAWFFSQPQYCADAHMLKHVPCNPREASMGDQHAPPPLTYSALGPASN